MAVSTCGRVFRLYFIMLQDSMGFRQSVVAKRPGLTWGKDRQGPPLATTLKVPYSTQQIPLPNYGQGVYSVKNLYDKDQFLTTHANR